MGYTTRFSGRINVEPPFSPEEISFFKDLLDYMDNNREKYSGAPTSYCQWISTDDGTGIKWDGNEKFYDSVKWMRYIIDTFIKTGKKSNLPFLQDHMCNGIIIAQGEEAGDVWKLVVSANFVAEVEI